MDIRLRLARNLKQQRERVGWSQEQLGLEADIHRTYISDLERGARNPTIQIVERLAKVLKVRAGSLLD